MTWLIAALAGFRHVVPHGLDHMLLAMQPSRLVPSPHRHARLGADRLHGPLLDDREALGQSLKPKDRAQRGLQQRIAEGESERLRFGGEYALSRQQ